MANSEDPDEMLPYAAFHQDLPCLLRQNQSSEKEIQKALEIITCEPFVYKMDHLDLNYCMYRSLWKIILICKG